MGRIDEVSTSYLTELVKFDFFYVTQANEPFKPWDTFADMGLVEVNVLVNAEHRNNGYAFNSCLDFQCTPAFPRFNLFKFFFNWNVL